VQDLPALAAQAHAHGAIVLADNTWATPLYCNPLALGADVVIHAATKYLVGHADAMLGTVSATTAQFPALRATATALGQTAGPDDCFLALRGLRTLAVRLARHQETGLLLARWLAQRPEVEAVLHPALPGFATHARWQRDFRGASGLFSLVLKPVPREALARFCDGLAFFGLGFSWGGFESLLIPVQPTRTHRATPWPQAWRGPVLRVHAGLEAPADLIADLERAFARL
jgi:cystathionine beta-lyase